MKGETKKRLQTILEDAVETQKLAGGCLLVVREGKEVCYLEAGMAESEKCRPIRRDQIYRLYSMSKPVTSAAVMKLMENGMVDLAQPVSDFIPSFADQQVEEQGRLVPCRRAVTVRDLLNMTSGLVYDGCDGLAGAYVDQVLGQLDERLTGSNPMSTQEFAKSIGKGPLAFHPGKSWQYGTSADILGAVVEIISGMSFGEYLQRELFEPLGMKDTGFFVPEEKRELLAAVYSRDGDGHLVPYHGNHLGIINAMDRKPAFESGGAGLVSTVDDYARFARMLLQGGELDGVRVLKPKTVQFMTCGSLSPAIEEGLVNYFPNLSGYHYGNLVRVMKDPGRACLLGHVGEYGWDGWLGCHFSNDPSTQTTILFMMQVTNSGTTHLVRRLRNVIISE